MQVQSLISPFTNCGTFGSLLNVSLYSLPICKMGVKCEHTMWKALDIGLSVLTYQLLSIVSKIE